MHAIVAETEGIQLLLLSGSVFLSFRRFSDTYSRASTFSLLRSLVVLLPISVLNVIVFYWIFSALHENIEVWLSVRGFCCAVSAIRRQQQPS